MKPRAIYQKLCEACNLDAAVDALTGEELTAVAAYIAGLKRGGGVPAQIFGVISAKLATIPSAKS
jgi:hypothetical protein